MFTEGDLKQIQEHGLTPALAERQMARFASGFAPLDVVRAAVAGDGVQRLGESEARDLADLYERLSPQLDVVKFVPASGAATRMFKDLFEFLATGTMNGVTEYALANLDQFAFADELRGHVGAQAGAEATVKAILGLPGLNYGRLPKGLVAFHKYPDGARTPVEEHLCEGAMYARGVNGVRIHFTVSGEHEDGFKKLLDRSLPTLEKRFGTKFDITFSRQSPSTDTLAANGDDTPFREADGRLLLRPAGHGALLGNLNAIDADLIFIKNIDNVTPDGLKAPTVLYKKALAGLLLTRQREVFDMLALLERDGGREALVRSARFVEQKLSLILPEAFPAWETEVRRDYIIKVLDRPMRVCGVVRNDGEPGGGPFWVRSADGSAQLQIVESSQIAPGDTHLMRAATHFNPVDLFCAPRDRRGVKYDLGRFVDPGTGFISEKSKDGRTLRAQELPGLWNGAMAHWTTLMVEVPTATFTPVKVVADLLREQHR